MPGVPTFREATIARCSPPRRRRHVRTHLWHPFTQMRGWRHEHAPVDRVRRGRAGSSTRTGRRYIDGVSSLWCNVHGHRHPRIDAAVRAQLDRVAHSTMLGLSHPGAEELARRLVAIAPGLADGRRDRSPASSTPTAARPRSRSRSRWRSSTGSRRRSRSPSRTSFVCLENAYHGDTVGSVSVGGIDLFHSLYRPLLFDAHPRPGRRRRRARAGARRAQRTQIAAVVVEPLVQGAAGHAACSRRVPAGGARAVRPRTTCSWSATRSRPGFGRTGTMFACEQEDVVPDFLCLAKGLTGGYLPLAATLTTERVYDGFLGEHDEFKTFFHGHTYTGNPLACAAALATLDVFEQERTLERLQDRHRAAGSAAERAGRAAPARGRGPPDGLHVRHRADSSRRAHAATRMGHQVTLEARARGAIVRPLGDVVVLMPPLSIAGGRAGGAGRDRRRLDQRGDRCSTS